MQAGFGTRKQQKNKTKVPDPGSFRKPRCLSSAEVDAIRLHGAKQSKQSSSHRKPEDMQKTLQ